jgi:hypothetical protein
MRRGISANSALGTANADVSEVAELVRRGVRTKPIIDTYLARGQISEEQHETAQRF